MTASRKGQAPYGFRWNGGRLEVVASEARIRKVAFEQFVAMGTKGAVARKLDEMGLPTRRGRKWSDMQVGRLLTCPSAIGAYSPGEKAGVAGSNDSPSVVCESIIPMVLWREVQAKLAAAASGPGNHATAAKAQGGLFGGRVVCSCGGALSRSRDGKRLECGACGRSVVTDDLEAAVVADIAEMLAGDPRLAAILHPNDGDSARVLDLAAAENEVGALEAERRRLEELVIAKTLTTARFSQLEAGVNEKLVAARRQIAALEKRKSPSPAVSPPHRGSLSAVFRRRWQSLTAPAKSRIIGSLIDRIIVGPDALEIVYLYGDTPPKDDLVGQHSSSPTNHQGTVLESGEARYLRLPKQGQICDVCGLSRAKLNELILSNKQNGFRPPVKSISLRKHGQVRGARLIVRESLLAYLREHEDRSSP